MTKTGSPAKAQHNHSPSELDHYLRDRRHEQATTLRLSITRAAVYSKDSDWQRVLASYATQPLAEAPNIGIKAVWSVCDVSSYGTNQLL